LALVLLEIVKQLPEYQRDRLAAEGAKLTARAERELKPAKREGAA
jgi:hypothetical protein